MEDFNSISKNSKKIKFDFKTYHFEIEFLTHRLFNCNLFLNDRPIFYFTSSNFSSDENFRIKEPFSSDLESLKIISELLKETILYKSTELLDFKKESLTILKSKKTSF